jgi:hypothetical protein
LKLIHGVQELLMLFWRKLFDVDIQEVCDFRHPEPIRLLVPLGVPKGVLTQNVYSAPITQQAEKLSFARAERE